MCGPKRAISRSKCLPAPSAHGRKTARTSPALGVEVRPVLLFLKLGGLVGVGQPDSHVIFLGMQREGNNRLDTSEQQQHGSGFYRSRSTLFGFMKNSKRQSARGRILPLNCCDGSWVQSQVQCLRSRLALNVLPSTLIGEHQHMTSIGILKGHVVNIGQRSFGTNHARPSLNDFRIVRERPILPAARYRVRLGI